MEPASSPTLGVSTSTYHSGVSTGAASATPLSDGAVRAVVSAVADEPGPVLLALQAVQAHFGYVDPSAVPVIADVLNVSRAEVHGVVSFYADLRTTPPGAHRVQVCRGEACQARGGRAVAERAQRVLGTQFGQTATDGTVTLEQVFCLGNCALGPAVTVDGRLHGRVSEDSLSVLLAEART